MAKAAGPDLLKLDATALIDCDQPTQKPSPAQRAVERWTSARRPGALQTSEDWREWQSNTFASCILMPEWSVCAEFQRRVNSEFIAVPEGGNIREEALRFAGAILFDDVDYDKSMAELFAVSRQAMAIRLLDRGLVRGVQEVQG
jgi:hypothetical protein